MYLVAKPKIDDKGNNLDTPSTYQPNKRELDRDKQVFNDFQLAQTIRDNTYEEFGSGNDSPQSMVEFKNKMMKRFNNVIPSPVDDPYQSWRANTIRPITRNKCISVIAHLTNSILYPGIIAQNEESVEDADVAMIMRDGVEWTGEQSNYEDCIINIAYELCYSPAVIIEQGYRKVMRTIKEIGKNGGWKEKEIVDERYSGYYNENVPIEELYIENINEPDIQKQGFLIRVRPITFSEAKSKYGDRDNFKHVRPGYISYFNEEDNQYYDQRDEIMTDRLAQEAVYYNKDADLELTYINGILMDDPDNPNKRKDKRYPFAKTLYEKFHTTFFYGMPLCAKIKPDQDVIDTLYNMIIDGTYLSTFPVLASYGINNVDSSILAPANVVAFDLPNGKIEPINTNGNLNNAMNVLQKVEGSASESSQDALQSGQGMSGDRTKYEIQRLEMNARTMLGLAGKSIGSIVKQFGQLTVDCICQYMPIAEINELADDNASLKFPKLFIPEKKGEQKGKYIEFSNEMPESQEEENAMGFKMLSDEMKKGYSIFKVNPKLFRNMKYLIKVEPEFIDPSSKFYKKLQLYDRAIMNPLVNPEVATKKLLLNAYVPGEEEEYMKKPQAGGQPGVQEGEEMLTKMAQNKKTAVTQIATPTPEMGL